jgi:MFS family permease
MWIAFLVNLLAFPMTSGLLPYIAKEIYRMGPAGLATLVASFAAGAMIGSLTIGVIGRSLWPARTMLICTAGWFGLVLLFVQMPEPVSARVILVLAGFAQSMSMVPLAGMLLKTAGPRYRGRVMGVRMLAIYGLPIGLMGAGALIPWIGYHATATLYCASGLGILAIIAFWWRTAIWPLDAIGNQR